MATCALGWGSRWRVVWPTSSSQAPIESILTTEQQHTHKSRRHLPSASPALSSAAVPLVCARLSAGEIKVRGSTSDGTHPLSCAAVPWVSVDRAPSPCGRRWHYKEAKRTKTHLSLCRSPAVRSLYLEYHILVALSSLSLSHGSSSSRWARFVYERGSKYGTALGCDPDGNALPFRPRRSGCPPARVSKRAQEREPQLC